MIYLSEDIRIILAGLWIALMLTYLLGDVLRIFAGDFSAGEMNGVQMTQWMVLFLALLMLLPIIMLILSLTLAYPMIRWITIIVAISLFIFNIVGLPGYPVIYDKFLIIVGLVFNVITV